MGVGLVGVGNRSCMTTYAVANSSACCLPIQYFLLRSLVGKRVFFPSGRFVVVVSFFSSPSLFFSGCSDKGLFRLLFFSFLFLLFCFISRGFFPCPVVVLGVRCFGDGRKHASAVFQLRSCKR